MDHEREFRQRLANKISGSCMGAWLLAPELHRLGAWELLRGWTGQADVGPRIALQLIHETALCAGRIRRKNSPAHQGLAAADGDIRVKDDTIIITFYGACEHLDTSHYTNLPGILQAEGLDPRIPWLYNFKLDFRFK